MHSRFLHIIINHGFVKVDDGYDECFYETSDWLSLLKDFLIFFWAKICLAKGITSFTTSIEIKLGKSDDKISSDVFNPLSASVVLI